MGENLKLYEVTGSALAPVVVRHVVKAKNEKEAMKKVAEMFKRGDKGAQRSADDEASALDYVPMMATYSDQNDTEEE